MYCTCCKTSTFQCVAPEDRCTLPEHRRPLIMQHERQSATHRAPKRMISALETRLRSRRFQTEAAIAHLNETCKMLAKGRFDKEETSVDNQRRITRSTINGEQVRVQNSMKSRSPFRGAAENIASQHPMPMTPPQCSEKHISRSISQLKDQNIITFNVIAVQLRSQAPLHPHRPSRQAGCACHPASQDGPHAA